MLTGLTGFLPESTLTLYDNLEFLFRILLSAALGAAIGLERTKRQKEAGVRTHCIIACASAVFMILSKYAFIDTAALDGSRGRTPPALPPRWSAAFPFWAPASSSKTAALSGA